MGHSLNCRSLDDMNVSLTDVPRRVGAEHHQLVAGAPRDAPRGRHDGVPQDRPGPGNVRRQLLRDTQQEDDRALAGSGRARPEYL